MDVSRYVSALSRWIHTNKYRYVKKAYSIIVRRNPLDISSRQFPLGQAWILTNYGFQTLGRLRLIPFQTSPSYFPEKFACLPSFTHFFLRYCLFNFSRLDPICCLFDPIYYGPHFWFFWHDLSKVVLVLIDTSE